ncbi:MAG: ABC transporter ATP-binding protein [Planctomycetales bacterium]|nr:ABC transporter ATP-binding protein [Planctomycetales bacterium]
MSKSSGGTSSGTSSKTSGIWRVLREELGPLRSNVVAALVAMAALAATDLLRPWPLKFIFDYVLLDRSLPSWLAGWQDLLSQHKGAAIVLVSLSIVVLAGLRGAFAYAQSYQTARIGSMVSHSLRNRLFCHLQQLSMAFHSRQRTGELMTKLAGDVGQVKSFLSDSASALGAHLMIIVGSFTLMFLMNWKLALVVALTFPVLVWTIYLLHHRAKVAAKRQRSHEDRMASHLNETLSSMHLVQAFGRERHEANRFQTHSGNALSHSLENAKLESAAARAVEITTAAGTCAVICIGSLLVLRNEMSPGMVLVFSSYLHGLYRPIRRMVKLVIRISRLQVSGARIGEILAAAPQVTDRPDALVASDLRGEIVYEGVTYAYGSHEPALRDVSFRIAAGQHVAIVGKSGAGKSTLVSALLRLFDPDQGRITIDGVDLRDYQRESLRRQVAVVLQDSVLRGASIYENIAYGNLDATPEQVLAAAQAADAHRFIAKLPNGYDTIVGEKGATLSGGQQRRIAIARALVRNASILILDEPMTGLDSASEQQVSEQVRQLLDCKTCLLITHDREAALQADWALVLDDGRLVAAGPPHEVLSADRLQGSHGSASCSSPAGLPTLRADEPCNVQVSAKLLPRQC